MALLPESARITASNLSVDLARLPHARNRLTDHFTRFNARAVDRRRGLLSTYGTVLRRHRIASPP